MKLLISIEYRTRWGEQLVMRIGKRRIALQYADGGVWTGAIERYTQSEDTEYRYEIERDGACIRSEWRPHTLRLPAREGVRTLRIRDRWQEMPSDTPFYSSAFTRGIFGRGKTGSPKKATGNITLRVVLIFFALTLLQIPFLKVVGAALLLWIGIKLLMPEHEEAHGSIEASDKLWAAVKTVIVADFVMSLDNVIAIAGAAETAGESARAQRAEARRSRGRRARA